MRERRRLLGGLVVALMATATAGVASPGVSTLQAPTALGPPAPKTVHRVVTVAPSLSELVLALGKGALLVGVSRFDTAPELSRLPRVGGFVDPSVEAILKLKPDLLLVQPAPGNQRPVERLADLGVSVLALPLQSVQDVLQAVDAVGRALGAPAQAAALGQQMRTARAEVRQRAKGLKAPRVLVVYGFSPLVVAGKGSFAAELLEDAGGVNAAGESGGPYPVYPVERVLRAPPDVLLDAADAREGRDALKGLLGAAHTRWVTPPNEDLLHPGPKLSDALRALFHALHPEAGP